jgi:glucose-1-phosphate adenylyltransferase
VRNTLLGAAAVIHENVRIRDSIIRRECVVEEDVEIEDSIIMDYVRVGKGSRLRRVIIDRHNNIEPGTQIGFDREVDSQRYTVTDNGVTVVPGGQANFYARAALSRSMGGYAE